MSGISEIKKKTKLSIDEMYDNQSVGNLDTQEDGKKEIKQTSHPANNKENHPDFQINGHPSFQNTIREINHPAGQTTIHKNGKMESNPEIRQEPLIAKQITAFAATKPQVQKTSTYKMTFNLTEEIYKAFNDLYANRMLQGRKTEKSEMICEAIQWLIKMEEEEHQ